MWYPPAHPLSRGGVIFILGFLAGGSIESIKFSSLARFLKIKTLISKRPLNFAVFIFASVKGILFWWLYYCNFYHADYDRKLKTIPLLYAMFLLFPTFFSKMFHYPYFSTLKYLLYDKNTEFLLRSLGL